MRCALVTGVQTCALPISDIEFGIRSDFQAGDVKIRLNASPFVGWYSGVQVPISGLNTQATCSPTAPGGTDAPLSPDGDCNPANDPAGGTLLIYAGKRSEKHTSELQSLTSTSYAVFC